MTETLLEAVTRHTEVQPAEGLIKTAIEGLTLLRSSRVRKPSYIIHKPALCIVVQGAKWAIFGDRRIEYGAGQAMLVSVEMPVFGTFSEASPSKPYLGIIVEFDLGLLREVWDSLDSPPKMLGDLGCAVFVTDIDGPLSDCVLRLVRLLDTPGAIPALYPLILREISFWLLTGPHGAEFASLVLVNSHSESMLRAIHSLRDHFARPVRIKELAATAMLSPSAFHRQFKAIMSMTPLQYQKQLRLLEARRLMLTDGESAEAVAHQVGYESPSQFSREYTRMFGAPPRRDITRMQVVDNRPMDDLEDRDPVRATQQVRPAAS